MTRHLQREDGERHAVADVARDVVRRDGVAQQRVALEERHDVRRRLDVPLNRPPPPPPPPTPTPRHATPREAEEEAAVGGAGGAGSCACVSTCVRVCV